MGFYGNISNTNRTQFVFDKIYPNRTEMDSQVSTDGIFIGRYVLVDYHAGRPDCLTYYKRLYKSGSYYYFLQIIT